MSPSSSIPISCSMPQTPHVFLAIQTALSSAVIAVGAGMTFSFLIVYSPQVSQAWPLAMRSARSFETANRQPPFVSSPASFLSVAAASNCFMPPMAPMTPAASDGRKIVVPFPSVTLGSASRYLRPSRYIAA